MTTYHRWFAFLAVMLTTTALWADDAEDNPAHREARRNGHPQLQGSWQAGGWRNKLESLSLSSTTTTDAGLKVLAPLTALKVLDLTETKVSDVGLKELTALKSLQGLVLNATKVTDAGLKELAPCKELQALAVYGCSKVTDAGIAELKKTMPKLKVNGK